jgi:hypothetical protein
MSWKFWSNPESIANETPSIMAVIETVTAVGLYWYCAIHFENYLPLIFSSAIAPLVLLRSKESISLAVEWFLVFEWMRANPNTNELEIKRGSIENFFERSAALTLKYSVLIIGGPVVGIILIGSVSWALPLILVAAALAVHAALSILVSEDGERLVGSVTLSLILPLSLYWWIASNWQIRSIVFEFSIPFVFCLGLLVVPLGLGVFFVAFLIRSVATARHIRNGIKALPANFRRLTLCTSPSELPELVPGLSTTASAYTLEREYRRYKQLVKQGPIEHRVVWAVTAPLIVSILYLPAWLFRFTIKSTAWFWWPMVYLGASKNAWRDPEYLHWRARYGLLATATYIAAAITILSFIVTNIIVTPDVLTGNPLLVVYGYLFLADWNLYPWQALSLLLAALSFVILFWIDDLGAQYKYAKNSSQLKRVRRKLVWFEWLLRLRLIVWRVYMIVVGPQIALFLNYKQCLITPGTKVQRWATEMYGERAPPLCGKYRL